MCVQIVLHVHVCGNSVCFASDNLYMRTCVCALIACQRTSSYTLMCAVQVNVSGTYIGVAAVQFLYRFNGTGTIDLTYMISWQGPTISPRQIGVVFDLPLSANKLSWTRKGQWSHYPPHMIGRVEGSDVEPHTCPSLFDACPHGKYVG